MSTAADQAAEEADRVLVEAVREEAAAIGFDDCRIARTADFAERHGERLAAFVADGRHGDMSWMAETLARRRAPHAMWPQAQTAIMLAASYAPADNPLDALKKRTRGVISCYARGRDYHDVLKKRLKRLARWFQAKTAADVKVFVDTAPLLEKPLAATAGIGWQGKHTNLVSRTHGSWLFLGSILTTHALPPDAPAGDHCGSCRACLDICPTAAFPAPYQLDARRCIAYLTIESRSQIPREFRIPIGNRIFGCDDCLAVCPWNKFAEASRDARLAPTPARDLPHLGGLLALDDAHFRDMFAGTPVKRTGRDRFVRNVLVAAGNAQDRSLIPAVRVRLDDAAPIVRGMAVWALGMLADRAVVAHEYARRAPLEHDPDVLEEWRQTLADVDPARQGAARPAPRA